MYAHTQTHRHLISVKGIQDFVIVVFQRFHKLMHFSKKFLEKCASHGNGFLSNRPGSI